MRSWVDGADGSPYDIDNLPYAATDEGVVVAIGRYALQLFPVVARLAPAYAPLVSGSSLDALLAAGPQVWAGVRALLAEWLTDEDHRGTVEPHLRARESVSPRLPFTVGDYVDFYASEQHATNLGRLLRPGSPPLLPNWHHLPVGYHGRSGTVVVSGTPIPRPCGQRLPDGTGVATAAPDVRPVVGPTERLDVEVEVGFVVGVGSRRGDPVPVSAFEQHVFGVCLVNDWSARDIQAWEGQPLGPLLGKSFATSVSAWVTPLAALQAARVPVASRSRELSAYLREQAAWGLAIDLELQVNGEVVSTPSFASMYWSPAQMLAHLTINGASLRTGDLFASGTVSGERDDEVGSLFERYRGERFLDDGDEVSISATAPGANGGRIALGPVTGRVSPAAALPG